MLGRESWRGVVCRVGGEGVWINLLPGREHSVRVGAERQQSLYRLVRNAASRLGVPVPGRIWLGPMAAVQGGVGPRGADLVIGLPVVYALSHAEVTALVEHELAVLAAAPSWGSSRRYRRWARVMDDVVTFDDNDRLPRSAASTLRRLGPRAELVERDADAACGDGAVAARALVRLARVADDFLSFCVEVEQALSRFGALRFRISDLHDGWRWRLSEGAGSDDGDIDGDEVAMVAGRHPFLAEAARHLLGQPLDLRPHPMWWISRG
jgi:hypothetical protein